MTHTDRPAGNRAWTPCRRHLFDARSAVAPVKLPDTYWLVSEDTWAAIKTDPDLRSDWYEARPGRGATLHNLSPDGIPRYLLGQPVMVGPAAPPQPLLILPVDCTPPRTPEARHE